MSPGGSAASFLAPLDFDYNNSCYCFGMEPNHSDDPSHFDPETTPQTRAMTTTTIVLSSHVWTTVLRWWSSSSILGGSTLLEPSSVVNGMTEAAEDAPSYSSMVLWSSLVILLLLVLSSIVPGRLHGYSAQLWRWPILALTYGAILVELVWYCAIRLVIRVAEAVVARPKHTALRRHMAAATSYHEWYRAAHALDQSQQRHHWLLHPRTTTTTTSVVSPPDADADNDNDETRDSIRSRNYNWKFLQELIKDMQLVLRPTTTPNDNDHNDTASRIIFAMAVIQQCTRCGPNMGGVVMNSDLFSYANTGEPKQLVLDFCQHIVDTLRWMTNQTLRLKEAAAPPLPTRSLPEPNNNNNDHPPPALGHPDSVSDRLQQEKGNIWKAFTADCMASRSTLGDPDQEEEEEEEEDCKVVPLHPTKQAPSPPIVVHRHQVLEFLKRTRSAYGRTALCLSGGAMMGLYHFGVIRGLAQEGLLPRIVSGTSAGSVVGALVCTRTNDDLPHVLDPKVIGPRMTCFDRPWKERLVSLWKHGNMFDIDEWKKKIEWFTNGNTTFEEAYLRTGRIFCITLSSTSKKASPILINYLSAPNVTIASAVLASAAVPGFISPVQLEYKDSHGVIRSYGEHDQTYYDGSIRQDIPTSGLAEMLNCQFFIASQCNPHIVPFFFNPKGGVGRPSRWSSGEQEHSWRGGFLLAALEMYLKNDMKAKCVFLNDLEAAVGFTSTMMTQEFVGSTTIVPQVAFKDYFRLVSDPDPSDLERYFQRGEVASYEHTVLIKLHFSIADALDECIAKLEHPDNKDIPNDEFSQPSSSFTDPLRRADFRREGKTSIET